MDMPRELAAIEDRLIAGNLDPREASGLIMEVRRKLGKPWHWPEWKIERDRLIKDRCEQCGSNEGPFVLQHTVQPPSTSAIYRNLVQWRIQQIYDQMERDGIFAERDAKIAEVVASVEPVVRPCCPKCQSTNISFRKGIAKHVCCSRHNRRKCGHVFEVPGETMALTPEQTRLVVELKSQVRAEYHEKYRIPKEEFDSFRRLALIEGLVGTRRYLSLQDTATYCKRCAFLDDMKGMRPCDACGTPISKFGGSCPACAEMGGLTTIDLSDAVPSAAGMF